jgi:hypothetical protein
MGPNSGDILKRLDTLRPAPLTLGSLLQLESAGPFLLSGATPQHAAYFSPMPVHPLATPQASRLFSQQYVPGPPLPIPLSRSPPAYDPRQDYSKLFLL